MTKADQKFVAQLKQKKYRNLHQAFVVEGWKSIADFIKGGFTPLKIYAIDSEKYGFSTEINMESVSFKQLKQISFLQHPKDALAIFKPKNEMQLPQKGLVLALDGLQDPGNLGTIIRTADWFGVQHIVCSKNTVDCYNPKVVQATMGALAHVRVLYTDLNQFLQQTPLPVFGTFLQGDNLFQTELPDQAVIVIGNEGNGIGKPISDLITHRITIPKAAGALAESLNASVATAVVLSSFCLKS